MQGPTSFGNFRTVNGYVCQTYHEACNRLGLLQDDQHWDHTIDESIVSSNAHQIRTLFAIILTSCAPSTPIDLWTKYKDEMCDDILHRVRAQSHNPHLEMCDEIHNEGLILLEDLCMTLANKLLIHLNMIAPIRSVRDAFQLELNRERQYDLQKMDDFIRNNVPLLNAQQTEVYNTLMMQSTMIPAVFSSLMLLGEQERLL